MLSGARPLPSRRSCSGSGPAARQQVGPSRRRPCTVAAPQGQPLPAAASAPVEPQWNDIVEYLLPRPVAGAKLGLGRVDQVDDGGVTLTPLEQDEEDMWVESHDASAVMVSEESVVRVLEYDFSQRQDKEGNPHGEHAHDVYTLLDRPAAEVFRGLRTLKIAVRGPQSV